MHLATENGFLFFGWNRKKILEYILGNANVHSSPPHSFGCADRKLNLRMGKGLFFFFFGFFCRVRFSIMLGTLQAAQKYPNE